MAPRKAGDDMLLKFVNTGSQNGNCYILENDTEALILDAGVRYKEVLKALDYNISGLGDNTGRIRRTGR